MVRSLVKKALLSAILALALGTRAGSTPQREATMVIVVRHAEKAANEGLDPPLSPAGLERAQRLAAMLRDTGISAVFVSDTRRARATAMPLVSRLGLTAEEYPGRDVAALVDRIVKDQIGKTVLVVGHSNTVPEIVAGLARGRQPSVLRDDEYDAFFLITIGQNDERSWIQLRY